jgi:hypothetical protein
MKVDLQVGPLMDSERPTSARMRKYRAADRRAHASNCLLRIVIPRKALCMQTLMLVWMSVQTVISLGATWLAHSPALLAFGGDSAVELLSATVVF